MTLLLEGPRVQPSGPRGQIELRRLEYRYGAANEENVLAQLDLTIDEGSFVVVVGPSGAGKTTLLRLLAGFLEPTGGSIEIDGAQVRGPASERGVVFQQPTLYPWLTVRGNVQLGPRLQGVERRKRRVIADELLDLVGLREVADRPPYELSGGMQQRVALARALAGDPAMVLLDEPLGALDAITRVRLQQELKALWARSGKTFFMITHSVDEAIAVGTRVLVLGGRPGRIVLDLEIPDAKPENGSVLEGMKQHIVGAIAQLIT